jgi:DNA polymerase-3 subunit epsilon
LKIDKTNIDEKPITTFSNLQSAKSFMFRVVEQHTLCQKLTGLYPTKSNCFNYTIKSCNGACINEETVENYNKRVEELIIKNSYENKNMLIIDQGREIDEKSVIYIENGVYKGLGFYDLNHQINNIKVLESIITPMENNRDTQHIIQSYLRRHKKVKTLSI